MALSKFGDQNSKVCADENKFHTPSGLGARSITVDKLVGG